MDKIETALTATEDNAAAIRALSNRLREQTEKTDAAIEELSTLLNNKTENLSSKLELRTNNKLITGANVGGLMLSFGTVDSDGSVCALLIFNTTNACNIIYSAKVIASLKSPALVILPRGSGKLTVQSATSGYALVLAPCTRVASA